MYMTCRFEVDLCGWRLESSCDSGASTCLRSATNLGAAFTATGSRLGAAVALVGDLDGDGVADAIAGAPNDGTAGADAGAVYVVLLSTSGGLNIAGPTTSGVVKLHAGASAWAGCAACMTGGEAFGSAVAGLGDVDGNGVPDVAVAAAGAVYILYMAVDRSAPCVVCPPVVAAHDVVDVSSLITAGGVPSSLAPLGDWDGGGLGMRDLAMGYTADATGGADYGAVFVLHLSRSSAGVVSLASSVPPPSY
jgi:hypothetical protein